MRCTSQSPTIVASVANRRNCSSGLMPSRDCSHSIMGGQARDRGCGAPDAPALDYRPTVPSDHGETMRSLALLVVGCVAAARVSAQQAATLRIGSAAARPGEKGSGFVDVPAGVDSGTRVPLTIVRGKDPGPTLALIAGTHGDEVAPVIALQRVRRELDPVRLAGTVLLVHVANLPSFLRRTIYYSPIDGKNLNRVYPGKRDGTVSERIADAITREIIERADYLVDIHAGDGNESLRPYTYWSPLGLAPRADSVAREMALAWGNDYIVIDTARPRDPRASVYTQNTAHLRGKPASPPKRVTWASPPRRWSPATCRACSGCSATSRWSRGTSSWSGTRYGSTGPRFCAVPALGSGIPWSSGAMPCRKGRRSGWSPTFSATPRRPSRPTSRGSCSTW